MASPYMSGREKQHRQGRSTDLPVQHPLNGSLARKQLHPSAMYMYMKYAAMICAPIHRTQYMIIPAPDGYLSHWLHIHVLGTKATFSPVLKTHWRPHLPKLLLFPFLHQHNKTSSHIAIWHSQTIGTSLLVMYTLSSRLDHRIVECQLSLCSY